MYYTPSINEFHIGFECEFKNDKQDNAWEKQVCDIDLISIAYNAWEHDDNFSESFRVKVLDQEDCLDLGFSLKVWSGNSGFFYKENYTLHFCPIELMSAVRCLLSREDYGSNIMLFQGDVRNKSELARILRQVSTICMVMTA